MNPRSRHSWVFGIFANNTENSYVIEYQTQTYSQAFFTQQNCINGQTNYKALSYLMCQDNECYPPLPH